jgi:hypothetical protein
VGTPGAAARPELGSQVRFVTRRRPYPAAGGHAAGSQLCREVVVAGRRSRGPAGVGRGDGAVRRRQRVEGGCALGGDPPALLADADLVVAGPPGLREFLRPATHRRRAQHTRDVGAVCPHLGRSNLEMLGDVAGPGCVGGDTPTDGEAGAARRRQSSLASTVRSIIEPRLQPGPSPRRQHRTRTVRRGGRCGRRR